LPAASSLDVDDAIIDVRSAIDEELLAFLTRRLQLVGENKLVAADISDGLLVSVLKLIASNGKFPMEKGRFWQILDRHGPFSPLTPDDSARARLARKIESLLAAAVNENFEDGFDSDLSLELQRLVLKYGEPTVEIVGDLTAENRVAPSVAAEVLKCLGEIRNEETREARRQVLEHGLNAPSHFVRDGAVIGLSGLSDPRSIAALWAAAEREDHRLLRTNMAILVEHLKGLQP
jgi:hypothetical protein